MIYQIQTPLMIVGYIALMFIFSGAHAAPGDIVSLPSSTQTVVAPSAINVIKTDLISTGVVTGTANTKAVATQLDDLAKQPPVPPVKPSATTDIEITQVAKSNEPLVAAKPVVIETPVNAPINNEIPSDVRSVKSIDGLDIPAQIQSKIVPTNQASDVRVLIDISGSMKENDAENVRIPALNLIVEMLPDGARAGVWTFGQWVNMLIPPAKVDTAWRENAKQKAQKINSHGLRTNIGEAMEKATWKFDKKSDYDQNIILLTDGLVDIAKDSDPKKQEKNEAERQRILTTVLKQYQELGVTIHTIALSDKADKVLLERLALETNGTSELVNNSADLVKAFLKAFEQAAPEVAEQVPLSADNTFEIDASIQEFTALIFRKEGAAPTQLISPSGKTISQIKASESAKWYGDTLYDLVTLTTPEAGQWKIVADLDPDNRVTVVSDLKMEIANLPSTLFPGQQVDFEVYLHENGEVITNPDFLKLMTIEMTMTAESGRSGTKNMSDPTKVPEDGRYKESIKRLSKEGQYELKVSVDGKTFQRMKKSYIQVRQPIGFEIRKRIVNGVEAYAVRVIPQVPDIEVTRTRVIAKLKSPDATSIIQAVPWVEEGVWEAIIEPSKGPGEYKIAMNVKGLFAKDQEFRVKPDPIGLMFPIPADFSHEYYVKEEMVEALPEAEPALAEAPVIPDLSEKMKDQANEDPDPIVEEAPVEVSIPEEVPAAESEPEVKGEDEKEDKEEESSEIPSWIFILIPILTILLGVGGFFIYRMISKKKTGEAAPGISNTETKAMDEKTDDVSLNDGMDGEDFDEDFDLSDSDDDEDLLSAGGDLDDLDGLDLSNDEDDSDGLDDLGDMPDLDDPEPPEEAKDDIPDFDENFDIDAETPEPPIEDTPEETAAALDELDSVLDDLSSEDQENIPKLDAEDDLVPGDVVDEAPSEELEGEAAVDAALANLESELEDLDLGEDK
jgi:uncharacterized protein (TIGR03503 family)